jgi:hypothetical protein
MNSMRAPGFYRMDVSGDSPLKGNALARVGDADELSETTIASLAVTIETIANDLRIR